VPQEIRKLFKLPAECEVEKVALKIADRLHQAGHTAYLVGGSVRDRLLGKSVHEVDVTTDATPDQVQALFDRTVAVGAAFGVIVVVDGDINTEIATFRTDGTYQDGRHPDSVTFSDAEHDAERRDFTINGLFYDPRAEEIIDYVGGLADLDVGVVRAIGDPRKRFADDYLRMLRAVRFTARFDFELEANTRAAVCETAERITGISPERISAELTKMLTGPNPHEAFRLLDETGLLIHILPEISAMKGVKQPPQYHPEGDVWVHTLLLLENMPDNPSPELAWACLLHDVAKPPTFTINKHGREAFPCHAAIGADMTEDILRRFRCSTAFIKDVREMVYYHMAFGDVQKMKRSTLRRMMARPTFDVEMELHRIDCMSCHGSLGNYVFLQDKLDEFANEPPVPEPLLRGKDLIERGLQPGPEFGTILKQIEELQLNDQITDRDAALEWLDSVIGDR
jgi:poly(A) polymerase